MNIIWFKDCSYQNKNLVGGKNASLGELYRLSKNLNFNIADGFALTIDLYDQFIFQNKFLEKIKMELRDINPDNIDQLNTTAKNIKNLIQLGFFTQEQNFPYAWNRYKVELIQSKESLYVVIKSAC